MSKETEDDEIIKNMTNKVIQTVDKFFSRLGNVVGSYPVATMCICVAVIAPFGIGLLRFSATEDPYSLENEIYIPKDSDVLKHKRWVNKYFPTKTRYVTTILKKADNILSPKSVNAMMDIYKGSLALKTENGQNFSILCFRYGSHCLTNSLLEVWLYNETRIRNLKGSDILDDIMHVKTSPMYYNDFDITSILGRPTYSGQNIVSAEAAQMTWILKDDATTNSDAKEWEKIAVSFLRDCHDEFIECDVFASRTISDEGGEALESNILQLSGGYVLVIIYVAVVLGKFNCTEHKIFLALCGLLVIGLSLLFSFGFASAVGLEYGPIHSALAFLILGIGVDNMFVIVGTFDSLSQEERLELPLPRVISKVEKHAGISITVTSVTDIMAFATGATTVLPALRSFCLHAVFAILALYFLSATLFVAGATLDLKRIRDKRNACIICFTHKNLNTNRCSKTSIQQLFVDKVFSPFIVKLPVKIICMVIVAVVLCVCCWGVYNLKQDFDPAWFLPTDSYGTKYISTKQQYFPNEGQNVGVYCGKIDYFNSKIKFSMLYAALSSSQYAVSGSVHSWFKDFTDWLAVSNDFNITQYLRPDKYPLSNNTFMSLLRRYVTTELHGIRYSQYILFENSNGSSINASYISFQHRNFDNSSQEITAMDETQKLVSMIFGGGCFTYSSIYNLYETNRVIQEELYRNLGVALACVFLITLILVTNFTVSVMVFTCVIFTLVDVGGCMYYWGLTIDTVTCVILILAVGLAVDYAEHIGLCFMTFKGNRNDRVKAILSEMGVAVFNGGISTALAFVVVSGSNSYIFTTFFKVFLLIVIFGLFHGLIYLPIVLSWFGPMPYITANRTFHGEKGKDEIPSTQNVGNSIYVQSIETSESTHPENGQLDDKIHVEEQNVQKGSNINIQINDNVEVKDAQSVIVTKIQC